MKRYLKLFSFVTLVVAISLVFVFASTPTLYVNNKAVPAKEGSPFVASSSTYVPLRAVVTRMGDKYTYNKKTLTATVRMKNKKMIQVQAGKNYAKVNGKAHYLVWTTSKGVKYPKSHTARIKNGVFYVPAQFVRDVMKYPLATKQVKGKTVVYVGKLPVTKPATKPAPAKPKTTDPDELAKQEFLKTWTPPKIKSKMTNDPAKNMQILAKELGLYQANPNEGAAIFNPFAQSDGAWAFGVSEETGIEGVDLEIGINQWFGNRWNPEFYKTPYVLKEVFKFYELPEVYDILYRGIEKEENVDDKVGKWLTFGKRKVLIFEGKSQVFVQVKNLYQR
ncbi:UNVERIFIED_ORG: copper amine oxidase-like protein [Anoxybacillus amylolyticus]